MITKAGSIHFNSDPLIQVDNFSWSLNVWQLLSEQLGRPARILHMQCGDGALAIELAKHGAQAVGIDSRADCILDCTTRTRQNNLPHLRFVHATTE